MHLFPKQLHCPYLCKNKFTACSNKLNRPHLQQHDECFVLENDNSEKVKLKFYFDITLRQKRGSKGIH